MTRTAIYSLQDNALTKETGEKVCCHDSARSLWKDGQKVEEGKDYKVREAEVSIYAEIGTKMKAIFKDGLPANGYEHEQKAAAKYLQPDTIYELSDSFVGDWHTDFRLKEFPGISFNSVHFVYPDPVAFPLPVKGMTTNDWMKVSDEPVKSTLPASAVDEAARLYPEPTGRIRERPYTEHEIVDIQRDVHITCAGMYTDTIDKLKAENSKMRGALEEVSQHCKAAGVPKFKEDWVLIEIDKIATEALKTT